MSKYAMEYVDGRVTEIVADDDRSAVRAALARLGKDACCDSEEDDWEIDGKNDAGEVLEKLPLYSSEDDGEPVAWLTVVRG